MGVCYLIGLREKVELLKDDRKRADRLKDLAAAKSRATSGSSLSYASPVANPSGRSQNHSRTFCLQLTLHRPMFRHGTSSRCRSANPDDGGQHSVLRDTRDDEDLWQSFPKHLSDDEPVRDNRMLGLDSGAMRRAVSESSSTTVRAPATPTLCVLKSAPLAHHILPKQKAQGVVTRSLNPRRARTVGTHSREAHMWARACKVARASLTS